jgi:glycosyltransferase involved in cell wall biosynthesis
MDQTLDCSIALAHHWLVRRRGGEKVLEALAELLPPGPVYTLVAGPDYETTNPEHPLNGRAIRTSWLQKLPGASQAYQQLAPLMPRAFRSVKLPPVDLVVCSDAALAKAMRPAEGTKLVCYCHSPVRYAWQPELAASYRATLPGWQKPIWDWTMARIRKVDYAAAQRVDQFVANSAHVARRIQRFYGRDSVVVHPPVDLPPFRPPPPRDDFYLCVGHHVPYKRLDLAVEACRGLQRKLVVIGEGPDVERLQLRQQPHVEYLGWQPDEQMHDYMYRARALLFPGEEDFGIVPVEAMARGCPVIAYGVGGACETVTDGATGVLFPEQTGEAIVAAIQRAESLEFDPHAMHACMQRFTHARFHEEMRRVFANVLGT